MWIREIPRCASRTAARTSRPTITSSPGANVRRQSPEQTVIGCGNGRLIWINLSVCIRGSGDERVLVGGPRQQAVAESDDACPELWCRGAVRVDGCADADLHGGA